MEWWMFCVIGYVVIAMIVAGFVYRHLGEESDSGWSHLLIGFLFPLSIPVGIWVFFIEDFLKEHNSPIKWYLNLWAKKK